MIKVLWLNELLNYSIIFMNCFNNKQISKSYITYLVSTCSQSDETPLVRFLGDSKCLVIYLTSSLPTIKSEDDSRRDLIHSVVFTCFRSFSSFRAVIQQVFENSFPL